MKPQHYMWIAMIALTKYHGAASQVASQVASESSPKQSSPEIRRGVHAKWYGSYISGRGVPAPLALRAGKKRKS